jgi:uncharacterized protein YjcR
VSKTKSKLWEDDHKRATFFVNNELLEKLNNEATEKGDKTKIINEALELRLGVNKELLQQLDEKGDKVDIINDAIQLWLAIERVKC